jgi:hypothetical protein
MTPTITRELACAVLAAAMAGPARSSVRPRTLTAEAAAHRRGLEGTLASYRETVKVALVHLDTNGQSERVVDAIRATVADTREDMTDMAADEAMTRRALELLGSQAK